MKATLKMYLTRENFMNEVPEREYPLPTMGAAIYIAKMEIMKAKETNSEIGFKVFRYDKLKHKLPYFKNRK